MKTVIAVLAASICCAFALTVVDPKIKGVTYGTATLTNPHPISVSEAITTRTVEIAVITEVRSRLSVRELDAARLLRPSLDEVNSTYTLSINVIHQTAGGAPLTPILLELSETLGQPETLNVTFVP